MPFLDPFEGPPRKAHRVSKPSPPLTGLVLALACVCDPRAACFSERQQTGWILMDSRKIAAGIPNYTSFLTVDELDMSTRRLVAAHPTLTTVSTIGSTRKGEPIEVLTIHGGPRNALLVGCPHPNEPIGTMTLEFLSERLCEDEALRREMGFTWHIIKHIDTDGLRLNEGWLKGPFSPPVYAQNYYRPAPDEQVEWTFPVNYKNLQFHRPLPETQALMDLMDQLKPRFLYSLHNSGFGGCYYYSTPACKSVFATLQAIPGWFGLPLQTEPEEAWIKIIDPGIFHLPTVIDEYEYCVREPRTKLPEHGAAAHEYAARCGSTGLMVEVPYFKTSLAADQSRSSQRKGGVMIRGLDAQRGRHEFMQDQLRSVRRLVAADNPFLRPVEAFTTDFLETYAQERKTATESPDAPCPATRAEEFNKVFQPAFHDLLTLGMTLRMVQDEVRRGSRSPTLLHTLDRCEAQLNKEWTALDENIKHSVVPIRDAVAVQLCAGLTVAAFLRDQD